MKKLLLIVPLSTLEFGSSTKGGVDSVCQTLIKDLVEREYNDFYVRILAFDQTSKAKNDSRLVKLSPYIDILHRPIRENFNGIKLPSVTANLIRIHKEIRTFKPDLVHSHLAPWLIGVRGPKTVATLHSYKKIGRKPVSPVNDLVYEKFLPWLSNFYIEQYTCVGRLLASELIKNTEKPTTVIGNPLNPVYFHSDSIKTTTKKIKFITCALLSTKKRIDEIIKLITRLHQAGIDVELTIIGPNVDNQYWQRLNELIAKEKADKYISFVGSKNTHEIKELYDNSDVGIFLSSEETFGLAPLEMLASGLPTISSNVGIIEERTDFFTNNGICIIDPTQEEEALAKVVTFINQPPVVNRDILKNEFSANAVNNQYFEIYKTLLNA